MCIICYKPQGVNLPSRDILKNCFDNNPDGAGIAILKHGSKSVKYVKGIFDFETLYEILTAENITKEDIAGIHFRIATNGAIEEKNCHPFYVSTDRKSAYSVNGTCKSVIFHNGVLSKKYSYDKKTSDSYLFALALAEKEKSLMAKGKLAQFIANETQGSRILYIHADLSQMILTGDWIEDKTTGCFFSNKSYSYSAWDRMYQFYTPRKTPGKFTAWENSVFYPAESAHNGFSSFMCPYCGDVVKIKQISRTYDIWECGECGELFDSYGNFLTVIRDDEGVKWNW